MWEPFHMDLEPEPLHKGFIQQKAVTKNLSRFPKSGPASVVVNGMMMNPYPHSQHMMIVKHLVNIWRGCGSHSTWVWSLNHCIKTSFSTKQ